MTDELAAWCESVEMIGGPADGTVWAVPEVPVVLRLAVPPSLVNIPVAADHIEALSTQVALYRRTEISDDTHHWRYVYEGIFLNGQ